MVRDNLDRREVQSPTQNCEAATLSQSQPPGGSVGPQQPQNSNRVNPDSQEPAKRQLDLLHWSKLSLQEEPGTWHQENRADAESLPTHLRSFSSAPEYKLVTHTYRQLQHSGYYWESMTMERAHEILAHTQLGTFLIRDSGQRDVFFTLSYQSNDGPTSVRVQLKNLLFSLYGSHRTFSSLFTMLTYYSSSSCKLTMPYRKRRPERLKQICRRALIRTFGVESISTLPGLNVEVRDYVHAYPYCI